MIGEGADKRAEGWKEIADVLDVSVKTARRMACRNVDPLPVRSGHRGVWAYFEALRAWVHRQDMAYAVARRVGALSAADPS